MQAQASQIAELKSLLADTLYKETPKTWPYSLYPEGIPQGAITEISGPAGCGKTEHVARLLGENKHAKVAWIESHIQVFATSLMHLGAPLKQILFIESGPEFLWCALQSIHSGLFDFVVLNHAIRTEMELRRLQLACEKSGTSLILLTERPSLPKAWPIKLQLQSYRKASEFYTSALNLTPIQASQDLNPQKREA